MISFDLSTYIYRPLRQVFRFVTTPENDFQWQYGTLASAQLTEGEMRIGAFFRTVGHYMGQRLESVFQVTDFEPNKIYAFKSHSGPMVSQSTFTFEIMDGRTVIHMLTKLSPDSFFKSTGPIIEKRVKKQYRENLALLKELLEASQVEYSPL